MGEPTNSVTSLTLIGRLRRDPGDQAAWNSFVSRYGPQIYAWCRRWKLQEADAHDVTQNVMVELAQHLNSFEHRAIGSFRSWLKTITHRAWCRFLAMRKRNPENGIDAALEQLAAPEAGDDLLRRMEEECERELLEAAMNSVRPRVHPHTWQAFLLTAVEGKSGAEAATALGINVGTVWVARSKVKQMLQEEVRRLEESE